MPPATAPHDHENHRAASEPNRAIGARAPRCAVCGGDVGRRARFHLDRSAGCKADDAADARAAAAAGGGRRPRRATLCGCAREPRRAHGGHRRAGRADSSGAEPPHAASEARRASAQRRATGAHALLPDDVVEGRVAQAANRDGAALPSRAAVQQAIKNVSTFLFCFRAVWVTVISRSANKLPRSL